MFRPFGAATAPGFGGRPTRTSYAAPQSLGTQGSSGSHGFRASPGTSRTGGLQATPAPPFQGRDAPKGLDPQALSPYPSGPLGPSVKEWAFFLPPLKPFPGAHHAPHPLSPLFARGVSSRPTPALPNMVRSHPAWAVHHNGETKNRHSMDRPFSCRRRMCKIGVLLEWSPNAKKGRPRPPFRGNPACPPPIGAPPVSAHPCAKGPSMCPRL